MGQKVHPTGFRLGISTDYSSKWYANSKDYANYLLEDYRIREYLKLELKNASVSKIVIENRCFLLEIGDIYATFS